MRARMEADCPMQPDAANAAGIDRVAPLPVCFAQLFDARGTNDCCYSDTARQLSGRDIVIEGYLSHSHSANMPPSLVDEPGVCPDCSAVPVAVIALPDLPLVPREGEEPVRIAGRLNFGLRIVNGTASMLRIENATILQQTGKA